MKYLVISHRWDGGREPVVTATSPNETDENVLKQLTNLKADYPKYDHYAISQTGYLLLPLGSAEELKKRRKDE